MLKFSFKSQLKFSILFIILLLLEGLYYHYYFFISRQFKFLQHSYHTGYNKFIWLENGIVEFLQVILLLFSIFFIIKSIFLKASNNNLTKKIVYIYFIGLLYYFFEEISWGQHIFQWQTPELFQKLNSQNETNLHNTNNLFNQLPRNLLLLWCSVSFFIANYLQKINFKETLVNFIYPNSNLKYISYLIIFFYLPDLIINQFNLNFGDAEMSSQQKLIIIATNIISFNFVKLSELHELLFDYYILSHAYYYYKHLKNNIYLKF